MWALLLSALLVMALTLAMASSKEKKAKKDENDNMGNTPFWLQDAEDQTCLGPSGFTICDERTLWILTRRKGRKTYSLVSLLNPARQDHCLTRESGFLGFGGGSKVSMGSCNKGNAQSWDFDFVSEQHVRLSTKGYCLVRGKQKYKNSMSVQPCGKVKGGGEFTPLVYHPTEVHKNGFYLKSADGTCFDGASFRKCEGPGSKSLFWGVGIKFVGGQANRYFFNFNPSERSLCIVNQGSKPVKAECTKSGALQWGLRDGQLSTNNGKLCVARLADNSAVLAKCSEASEYVTMEVPVVYTREDIEGKMILHVLKVTPHPFLPPSLPSHTFFPCLLHSALHASQRC